MAKGKKKNKKKEKEQPVDETMDKIVNGSVIDEITNLTIDDVVSPEKDEEIEEKEEKEEVKKTLKDVPIPKLTVKKLVTDEFLKNEKIPLRIWIVRQKPSPLVLNKLIEYLGRPSYDKIYDANYLTLTYNELASKIEK